MRSWKLRRGGAGCLVRRTSRLWLTPHQNAESLLPLGHRASAANRHCGVKSPKAIGSSSRLLCRPTSTTSPLVGRYQSANLRMSRCRTAMWGTGSVGLQREESWSARIQAGPAGPTTSGLHWARSLAFWPRRHWYQQICVYWRQRDRRKLHKASSAKVGCLEKGGM